ncbi:unnamed protein product [Linum tenue]|uniref:C2 domain-containing protein n=1 Tax=Linum tenue TaxID=586396 RepID=A0AAV0MTH2_9ROSI|nr:unnamed protein product [Linum tenue]
MERGGDQQLCVPHQQPGRFMQRIRQHSASKSGSVHAKDITGSKWRRLWYLVHIPTLKMAAAGTRTLEFTILSAEDLRLEGRPVKKNAFAVVKTDPFFNSRSTRADSDGGSYPQWNEKVVVEMPIPPANSVTLEVRSGNIVVGAAIQVFVIISFFHFL